MLRPAPARRWAVLFRDAIVMLTAAAALLWLVGCGQALASEANATPTSWPVYVAVLQLGTMVVGGLVLEAHRRDRTRTDSELARLSDRLAKTREQYVTRDDFADFRRAVTERMDGTFKEWAGELSDIREQSVRTEAGVARLVDMMGGGHRG